MEQGILAIVLGVDATVAGYYLDSSIQWHSHHQHYMSI